MWNTVASIRNIILSAATLCYVYAMQTDTMSSYTQMLRPKGAWEEPQKDKGELPK